MGDKNIVLVYGQFRCEHCGPLVGTYGWWGGVQWCHECLLAESLITQWQWDLAIQWNADGGIHRVVEYDFDFNTIGELISELVEEGKLNFHEGASITADLSLDLRIDNGAGDVDIVTIIHKHK